MRPLAITSALTALAAAVGSKGTDPQSDWYESLDQPAWQPPPIAFPMVWTPLYGVIAWSTGRAVEAAPPEDRRRLWALIGTDLVANAGWNWAFFAAKNPPRGMAVILTLDVLNVALTREVAKHDKIAAAALTPYVVWTGFATALNAELWRRNR